MDKLSIEQEAIAQKMVKKLELMGKEPIVRRTRSYIQQTEKEITDLWSTFEENHEEILKLNKTDHEYFTNNFHSQVLQVKQKALAKLSNYRADLDATEKVNDQTARKKTADATSNTVAVNNMENTLQTKRIRIRITSFCKQLEKINSSAGMSNAAVELHSKNVTEDWRQLELLHEELLMLSENEDEVQSISNQLDELREEYVTCLTTLQEKATTTISAIRPTESDVRLPRLNIPMFEGKYENWTAFHDIFSRLIHNNKKLANVEKMQYLKTNLRGEAARLLNHLDISDSNYTIAWEIIKERYENKRKLLSVYLQALFTLPKLEVESVNGLKRIHDTMKECLHSITNLGIDTTTWAPIVIHLVIQKLDHETLKLYEQSHESAREIPTFEHFYKFIVNRFQSLEAVGETKNRRQPSQIQHTNRNGKFKNSHSTTAELRCRYCQKSHSIYNCPEFVSLDIHQRNEAIRRNNLCRNCLNHSTTEKCYSNRSCSICHKQHHTLLHQSSNSESRKGIYVQDISENEVLLATALIKATSRSGKQEVLRVLLDTGSQTSCITEQAAQILSLPRKRTCVKLSGLGAMEATTAIAKVNVQVQPRFTSEFQMNIEALILPKLTKKLPNAPSAISIPWKNCVLADPTFNQPGPIDMIIGADAYTTIILNGIRKNKNVLTQNTEFGWVVSGGTPQNRDKIKVIAMISQNHLDNQLKRFWEIEETPTENLHKAADDICEEHYEKTHRRNPDGTYTVQIPFKDQIQPLGDSRRQALARLLQNEKKFRNNTSLEQEYKKFMAEYISLKHMELIKNPEEATENVYYLPHQAVIKNDNTTTKLRVVFDASAKTSTGVSLNDNMLAGPRLQHELAQILLRWRKHRFVFTADVEKMYRQIKLAEKDQHFHRVLWRFNPNEPIQEYKLTTVTYGTTSAPFLAVRTMQQLAKDEEQKYPQASRIVYQDFYVDDVMSGGNTVEEVRRSQYELIKLVEAGGFKLRKWTSNNKQILSNIPEHMKEKGVLTIDNDETIKTLGIHWNPTSDTFHFKVSIRPDQKVTKRTMLSEIARIFDPLGWITPITLRAKIMIQELWKVGISWDETPPPRLMSDWLKYQQKLSKLEELRLPRWINSDRGSTNIELHGFSDASERAYAAVIYCKSTTANGNVTIHLLTAKSKVAPIKTKLTIPRLELCGAELLSRLMAETVKSLDLKQSTIYLWSDSMITVSRIKGKLTKQPNFEANRIKRILSITNPQQWNHIQTKENPADCASRGMSPDQIKEYKLWWNGPSWLKSHKEQWPISSSVMIDQSIKLPKEPALTIANITTRDLSLFERFSTLKKCVRIIAYCKRFIDKCKKHNTTSYKGLTTNELINSRKLIIKCVQAYEFSEEIQHLEKKKTFPTKSKLLPLSVFIDKEGILRIGGRLQFSILSYSERHPILLPQRSHITDLIIQNAHLKTLHGGNQQTLAYIRREYWIINARSIVKKHIHNCNTCFRNKAQACQQIMGPLPSPRVTPSLPFTHTGVDYAGPIHLKASKITRSKTYKGYIAIFVCLSTKAIHIEAVSDLTSEAFIAAFKRFTARRGHCQHIYSDCGTNFIGAHKILEKDVQLAIQRSTQEVADMIANDGTQWHFNPPAAPHMGGIWEAGVKSIKYHLKRIVSDVTLTYEELTTTLNQIEACLNSRPLCPLTDDPTDCNTLTPGHFLIGRAPIKPPCIETDEKSYSHHTRWKLVNKLSDDFWKIWSSEYLSRLQQKPKWRKEEENLRIDELVLIKDENMPNSKWKLGRILTVHPGEDGKIRVVTVRCGNNTVLRRPVTKLCRLPMNEYPKQKESQEKAEPKNETPTQEESQETSTLVELHGKLPTLPTVPVVTEEKLTSPITTTIDRKRRNDDTPSELDLAKKRFINEIERARRTRKGVRIRPVTGYNNLVSEEKQKTAREKHEATKSEIKTNSRQPTCKRTGSKPSQWNTAITCLSLLSTISLSKAAFTITHPQPGLYIEHMGETNLRRGTLRVELTFPINTTADSIRIKGIIDEMQKVCITSKEKATDIHCESLVKHLKIQGDYLLREIDALNTQDHSRSRRGLLGKALQYVFGVNDEVYADISTLEHNQQSLQQTILHQSTIMLTTISHLNETEVRVTEKVNAFTNKLNDIMKEVNVIQGWFTKINTNMINLHILTAYQMATNVLDELERLYSKIISSQLGQRSFLEFLPSSKLKSIMNGTSKKLPSSLYITQIPEERSDLKKNETSVTLYGYFSIIEVDQYTIVKITPIPQKLENRTYIIADIPNNILFINYNRQKYFEIAENELKGCINENKHQLLCIPTAISNIESNPSCIIDEIYDRPGKLSCPVKQLKVPNILWKHLYMANTWLFITMIPVAAGIECNGIREDVELNDTGIIQITTDCTIKTKKNTLVSEVFNTAVVKSSFIKPIELNFSTNMPDMIQKQDVLHSEQFLRSSDQLLGNMKEQELLHKEIASTTLQTIGHHALSATMAVIISIGVVIAIIVLNKPKSTPHNPNFVLSIPSTPCPTRNQNDSTAEGENV